MKILLTGATGFIGGHLCTRLLERGDDVIALVRASADTSILPSKIRTYTLDTYKGLTDLFKLEAFDGVIHLATHYLPAHEHSDIEGMIASNILLGTQVFDAAISAGTSWIINTSTFTQHFEDKDNSSVNLYSATKQAFEEIAKYYAETTKCTIVTITPFDTFGPGDRRRKIVNILYDVAISGIPLPMSPGEQILDISPINNVIDGYDMLIEQLAHGENGDLSGKVFALPSRERMTLREFVSLFKEVIGKDIDVRFGERDYRPREVMIPWTRGTPVPGWSPRLSLREGIEQFIESKRL